MQTQRSWVQIPQGADENGGDEGGNFGAEVGVGNVDGVGGGVNVEVFVVGNQPKCEKMKTLLLHHMMKHFQGFFRKKLKVLSK